MQVERSSSYRAGSEADGPSVPSITIKNFLMNFFLFCGVRQGAKILQVMVEVSEGDAQMAKMCLSVGVKGRGVCRGLNLMLLVTWGIETFS